MTVDIFFAVSQNFFFFFTRYTMSMTGMRGGVLA